MKKSDLKILVKEVLKEITQKDIGLRYPQMRSAWDVDWNPNLKSMALANLKALREKARRMIEHLKTEKGREEELRREYLVYKIYDDEINRRLNYINKPVEESNLSHNSVNRISNNQVGYTGQATGYSHAPSNDYGDVQLVRDPLNDPALTDKLNEVKYEFKDFPWLARTDGFLSPSDVYYGSIYLGTIESRPTGYVIVLIDTPNGKVEIKQDKKNMFKTKDAAAQALHQNWKLLRTK